MNRNIILAPFILLSFCALLLAAFSPSVVPAPLVPPVLTDMEGSSVHVPLPAKRVLIFEQVLSVYLTLNEGPSHLLAVSQWTMDDMKRKIEGSVYPSLVKTPVVGVFMVPTERDVEEVMRLQPDVILSWCYPNFVDPLKAIHMSGVVGITYTTEKGTDYAAIWRLMGAITGRSSRTESLLERYAVKRQEVLSSLAARPSKQANMALLSAYAGEISIFTYWPFWLNDTLKAVGARNDTLGMKWGGENSQSDPEELMLLDPDGAFVLCDISEDDCLKNIYSDLRYGAIRAVRNHKLYRVPVYSFTNYFVEEPLLLRWCAEVLDPDVMPRRLREEYKETYQEVYHYSPSDDEIDKAIYMKENLQSAGYERFMRQADSLQDARGIHRGIKNIVQ